MTETSEAAPCRDCVVLAAGGDVSTGHEPPESAFTHVNQALRNADLRFAQVERVYSVRGIYQTMSDGEHARQPPSLATAFKSVPFDVLSIASNHTGDWGPEAVEDTIETFRELGIATIGAGRNIAQARQGVVLERKGLRIAFLGYVSVLLPQYWASEKRAGATPMRAHTFYEAYEYQPGTPARIVTVPHQRDLELLIEDVRRVRQSADVVVVSMHWGVHYTSKPADYQRIVARAAIDAGASAILGHHPHQPQGIEIYKDAVILYSLGNFALNRSGRSALHPLCAPNGEHTHEEVYSVEMDPGHYYDSRRHFDEGGIAFVELNRDGVTRATWLPTLMNAKGQPNILRPEDPQFEVSRRYLEWLSEKLPAGISKLGVSDGRYVLFERKR